MESVTEEPVPQNPGVKAERVPRGLRSEKVWTLEVLQVLELLVGRHADGGRVVVLVVVMVGQGLGKNQLGALVEGSVRRTMVPVD